MFCRHNRSSVLVRCESVARRSSVLVRCESVALRRSVLVKCESITRHRSVFGRCKSAVAPGASDFSRPRDLAPLIYKNGDSCARAISKGAFNLWHGFYRPIVGAFIKASRRAPARIVVGLLICGTAFALTPSVPPLQSATTDTVTVCNK